MNSTGVFTNTFACCPAIMVAYCCDCVLDYPALQIAIPSAEELLLLEQKARANGSGLNPNDLLGSWYLERVWSKGSKSPSTFAAGLLKNLSACLRLTIDTNQFQIINSISIGSLQLSFVGKAFLNGVRPILIFTFQYVSVSLGSLVIFKRNLPQPPSRKMPFFALIARNSNGWLAARGRGGGLALWILKADTAV